MEGCHHASVLRSPYSGADVPRRTDGAAGRFSSGVMYQSMNRFVASGGLSPAFNSLFDGLAGPRHESRQPEATPIPAIGCWFE